MDQPSKSSFSSAKRNASLKRKGTLQNDLNANDNTKTDVPDGCNSSKTSIAKKRKAPEKGNNSKANKRVKVSSENDCLESDSIYVIDDAKKRKTSEKKTTSKTSKRPKMVSSANDCLESDPKYDINLDNKELYKSWCDETLLAEMCEIPQQISNNIIKLIADDNTLPFIARYRKNLTENMTPEKLQNVFDQYENICQLRKRAKAILAALKKSNKLSSSLLESVLFAKSVAELELLYTPLKSQSGTLADRARKLGLESVAIKLMNHDNIQVSSLVDSSNKELRTNEQVEEHVVHIIADVIYKDPRVLEFLRKLTSQTVIYLQCSEAKSTKKKQPEKSESSSEMSDEIRNKYSLYFNFKNRIVNVKAHQVLAINRGESAKILSVKVIIPDWYDRQIENFCKRIWRGSLVLKAVNDACTRLIKPWLSRQVRTDLTVHAENESLLVFADNLERFLLTEPVKNRNILAIDPGFKAGCKVAMIGSDGSVLDTFVMYPNFKNYNDTQGNRLRRGIESHRIEVIALGNGTACRETESWLKNNQLVKDIPLIIIPEQGASIYSCSPEAQKEYPNMDPNLVSAISLAKRVLDPLAELVKVEPKHLGVGLYQHDIPPKKLSEALDNIVIRCVSMVGVDVNTASKALLRRVAGLTDSRAAAIIKYRSTNNGIKTRAELLKVTGIGPKTFKQCAGFMKVQNGTEPLDNTIIHPESYKLAKRLARDVGLKIENLGKEQFIDQFRSIFSNINLTQLSTKLETDMETIELIVNSFKQTPHEDDLKLNKPIFSCTASRTSQLEEGVTLTGIVRNVTPFGCFVDCGVGRDGLIHSSKMNGNRWPKLGERVSVLISAIQNPQRIQLLLNAIL